MTDSPKTALVTGASRGLGAAIALALAPSHHIVAVARTVGGLEELDDRIRAAGGSATLAPMDITEKDAMAQLCRSIHDRWGGLDLWVHTAVEATHLTPAAHLDEKDFAKAVATNVTATQRLIAYVAPLLGDAGAALFFEDDHAGEKFFSGYGATKAAQLALARSWQAESARLGPRILIARPRPLATALRARFHPGEDRSALAPPADEARRLLAEAGLIRA
ncbi:MAG TPA: SDR family NAD(P)-dependent oxidoreductase [Aliiroseovarius sp.]|nr:SDR family NAD(P)-dependent oxidoreductase [Aliiroseovarius sp.]